MANATARTRTRTRTPWLALLALLLLAAPAAVPAVAQAPPPPPLAGLDAWIETEMARWEIPGLAIAVVSDDRVVWARGFGVRRLGAPERVDEHTLFGVASTTKAMTVAALGLLVDEGRIHWDDPVLRHLPGFRLADAWVTEQVTIRDLLTHRVGVGRITGNRLRYLSNRPRSELVYRMRFHDFEAPFRSASVYSNAMYTVAGEIIPAVTGTSWDDFLAERLFRPLGMLRTTTSSAALAGDANAAAPHQEIDGRVQPIPVRDWTPAAPSAAVNTSAREMAEWLRLQLGEPGVHDGRRLLADSTMRAMHAPVVVSGGNPLTGTPLSGYGLGWGVREFGGRWISQHSGATDGMNTMLALVPQANLGVVVMTNTFNNLMTAVAYRVLDAYLGLPERDWGAAVWQGHQSLMARATARRDSIHAARRAGTRPSLPLAGYAGTYVDSLYLDATVRLLDGRLVLNFWGDPEMTADLEHWEDDTFRAVWRNRSMREEFLRFVPGDDGRAAALEFQWSLRPLLLQVGAYPTDYYRWARFQRAG
jgi:CubicO group peptidase (beta-lactamase class C family)